MLAFGIGCAIGGILGGFLGQKTYNYSPRMLPLFIGGCQASSVLPLWFLLHNDVIADDVDDSFHIIAVSVVTAFITGALATRVPAVAVLSLHTAMFVHADFGHLVVQRHRRCLLRECTVAAAPLVQACCPR